MESVQFKSILTIRQFLLSPLGGITEGGGWITSIFTLHHYHTSFLLILSLDTQQTTMVLSNLGFGQNWIQIYIVVDIVQSY